MLSLNRIEVFDMRLFNDPIGHALRGCRLPCSYIAVENSQRVLLCHEVAQQQLPAVEFFVPRSEFAEAQQETKLVANTRVAAFEAKQRLRLRRQCRIRERSFAVEDFRRSWFMRVVLALHARKRCWRSRGRRQLLVTRGWCRRTSATNRS